MRLGWLAIVLVMGGCARQHGGQESYPAAVEEGTPAGSRPASPWSSDGGVMFSFDAGWSLPPFGGPGQPWPDAPDASLIFWDAGPWPLLDAGSPPAWDGAVQLINPTGACKQPPPASDGSGTCRDWRWHTPACYRAPTECPALWESHYCLSLVGGGVRYMGMESGAVCQSRFDLLPGQRSASSVAEIGPDLFLCSDGIVLKVSLGDGSFETAALACGAVFAVDDKLVVHEPISGSLSRYESWQDAQTGVGKVLGFASPGALLAANSHTMAAMWPDGNLVSLMATDGSVTNRIWLEGFSGVPSGLDLSENDELFVANSESVFTFDLGTGAQLERVRNPGMQGLSCHGAVQLEPSSGHQPGAARPGAERPERLNYILSTTSCQNPFVGPRYVGANGGPELLVLATSQASRNYVRDERRTPHTLVLSSDDVTSWTVDIGGGAQLEGIIVSGTERITLELVGGQAPVEYRFGRASLGRHGGLMPGHDETMLRRAIEEDAQRPISELFGCISDGRFLVRDEPLPQCVH